MANHEQFDKRLDLARSILAKHNLKAKDITPLEYDPDCPFPYNNFIYKIDLIEPASSTSFSAANPACTSRPPKDAEISALILRLSNLSAQGLNQTNRVQNEVAALYLAGAGTSGIDNQHSATRRVFPAVYDWEPPRPELNNNMGWILMEFKPGEPLDRHLETLSDEQKDAVISQIADVFAMVQGAKVPETVKAYGGLTIDHDGAVVSGEMTTLKGGPWYMFVEFIRTKLASQLVGADESPALNGWRDNGVRERVDDFLKSGLESKLQKAGVDGTQRVLIHGDLTTNNILFDPATAKITGLVDFDFSYIGHPFQEYLSSFGDVSDEPSWDKALAARDTSILRPENMAGADTLRLLGELEGLLGPFRLVHPVFLKRQTAEQIAERRAQAENDLLACLEALGA